MGQWRAVGLQRALSISCLFYSEVFLLECVRAAEYKGNRGPADFAHHRKGML